MSAFCNPKLTKLKSQRLAVGDTGITYADPRLEMIIWWVLLSQTQHLSFGILHEHQGKVILAVVKNVKRHPQVCKAASWMQNAVRWITWKSLTSFVPTATSISKMSDSSILIAVDSHKGTVSWPETSGAYPKQHVLQQTARLVITLMLHCVTSRMTKSKAQYSLLIDIVTALEYLLCLILSLFPSFANKSIVNSNHSIFPLFGRAQGVPAG